MTVAPAQRGRIGFLDGVRGLAASIVVLQHLLANEFTAYEDWTADHLDLGRVGVVAFFLVSGYVIPLSLEGQTLRVFAIRRFFRLYPIFWVALAAYVVAVPASLNTVSPWVVLLNLLMLQGLIGAVSLLPVAWTLSIELLFYAQSATARATHRLSSAVHAGWAWLALYVLLCAVERLTGRDLPVTLPLLLYTAGLGQALYLRDRTGSTVWRALLVAGVLLVPVGAYLSVDGGEWQPFTYSSSFLVGLLLFGTFYWTRHLSLPRTLVWLGGISYALYLFHPTVLDLLERTSLGWAAMLAVAIVVVLVVSYACYRLLERPSQDLGRRLTRRPARPAQPGHEAQQPAGGTG